MEGTGDDMNQFKIKIDVRFGEGCLNYLESLWEKKVFVVTDPFMVESGMIERITNYLTDGKYEVFSDIVPDPPVETVAKGVARVTGLCPEAVVAMGGGSAIDAAKAIMDFSRDVTAHQRIEFVAIPTTSGTGSEVTSFAVITDAKKGIKYPLVSDSLLPDVALLDPELVKSVPAKIVADTGMDVLTHAIEAYVSKDATDFSDALAEKSAAMVFQYLKRSYRDAEDQEAREKMHYASCLAGMAFNMASLGLNHAIAHNIGGKLHVPHGRTNAVLLPAVIAFNAEISGYHPLIYSQAAVKYGKLAELIGFKGSNVRICVRNLIMEIQKMQKELGIPKNLSEEGVADEDFRKAKDGIIQGALQDQTILTNPRQASPEDIAGILDEIR